MLALPVTTWLPSPGALAGPDAASGPAEGSKTCAAARVAYLPLDFVKMAYDDLDGYRSRSGQPRPSAQKETDELTKRVLKGKTYAAWQNTPGSVSRPHLR